MRAMIRVVAILAGMSLMGTIGLIAMLVSRVGLSTIASAGALGVLTIIGWAITLTAGPVATVQLWRFRETGRRAGIILFGYGLAYYVVGGLILRAPNAPVASIVVLALGFAIPLTVLLAPGVRALFNTPSPRRG